MKNRAILSLAAEDIIQIIRREKILISGVPQDAQCVAMYYQPQNDCLHLMLEHDSFPRTAVGAHRVILETVWTGPARPTIADLLGAQVLPGVREYGERLPVSLDAVDGRLCVMAQNEGGLNSTSVDLLDLLDWLKVNRPELLK